MKNKIDIFQIRNAEKNYTSVYELYEKLGDFLFGSYSIEKEDKKELQTIYEKLSEIQDKLFSKGSLISKNYIKQNKGIAI